MVFRDGKAGCCRVQGRDRLTGVKLGNDLIRRDDVWDGGRGAGLGGRCLPVLRNFLAAVEEQPGKLAEVAVFLFNPHLLPVFL